MKLNPFPFSLDNKRYHTLNYYNKNKFGIKVHKAVLECGFTCPNIDGSKGVGGCVFCDGGSGYFTVPNLTVTEQLKKEYERLSGKFGNDIKFIAYFQANTNTYTSADRLEKLLNEAISFPNTIGISIGTRGDCLPDDIIELLKQVNKHTSLTVELGMQTMHDSTLSVINRCCSHAEFLEGFYKLKNAGIRTCLHLINGLPNESTEMMLQSANEVARMRPDAVKLQMLHIIKGTKLHEIYQNTDIKLLSREEYIDIIVKQLELLPAEIVIERITGDGDKSKLIAPLWSSNKKAVINGIDKRLVELDTYQGRLYCSPN